MTEGRAQRTALLMMSPGLGWLAAFMVVPCLVIFVLAFFERGVYGGIDFDAPTLENFARATDRLYFTILIGSARIALIATAISIVIAYPAAYAIAERAAAPADGAPGAGDAAVLDELSHPHLCLDRAAQSARASSTRPSAGWGWCTSRSTILYNEFAVILGLVYNYCPFVILAIYSALQRLDPSFAEASRDLGAGAWQTFFRITLPLTIPGVAAGGGLRFRPVDRQLHNPRSARRRQACRWSAISSTTSS